MPEKKNRQKDLFKKILLIVGALVFVFATFIAAQFLVGIPLYWILGERTLETPLWTTIYSTLVYIVAAALIIFLPKIVSKNFKTNREELGLTGLPTFTDMGISVLGIIATFIVAGVVVTILSNFPWFDAEQTQEIGYSTQIIGFDRVVAFLSLVVIAPIAEEIMFRGWLYGKLKKHISVPLAVFLVSALFGFIHGQLNVGVTVGIMSVIMCLERELTGTIYAGILTHMLKNGIAFYLLFIV
ncbi:CPBP family intramembrane metalloprotease [Candidatus Saccharibacteria bacterium]|nr:CPBP family intramembrane metalloprotease [Candidatus Saccharibacteria bacterium]